MGNEDRLKRIKKAYAEQVEGDSLLSDGVFSLTDLVYDGFNINTLSDLVIAKGLEQEGFDKLQDMMYFSDMSEKSWGETLGSLLQAAGLEDPDRCALITKSASKAILEYLDKNGFVFNNGLQ